MASTTIFEGIVFVEGDHPGAMRGGTVESDLTYSFGAQLKSLNDIERNLARQAEKKGFNAILDFEHGQESRSFAFDSVGLWGKGVLANIPRGDYERLRTS